jgi:hypothetical protein
MLTASRKLDRRELFLIVFLERRAQLGHKIGAFDRKGFDIYLRSFSIKASIRLSWSACVPATTSASFVEVSIAQVGEGADLPLQEALLPQRQKL